MKTANTQLIREPAREEIKLLVALFNQGTYAEVEILARRMSERFPDHGFAWKVLGAALKSQGRTAEALEPMQKAALLAPGDADAYNNLGITLKNLGRLAEAEACYRRALEITPDFVDAHSNLGVTLKDLGRLAEAEASCRRALEVKPEYVAAHINLGVTLKDLGRLVEAEASCRRALEITPDHGEAHNNLGVILKQLGRVEEAESCYRRALAVKPDYADAHNNLGVALKDLGRLKEAEAHYHRVLAIKADHVEAHNNLGILLTNVGRLAEAETSCRRALAIKPDFADAHSNLGVILGNVGRLAEAEASFLKALAIRPDLAEVHNNLGNTLKDLGRQQEAEASYRRALEIRPEFAAAHSNLIFSFSYSVSHQPSYQLEESCKYGQMVARKVGQRFSVWQCAPRPERLRVGFVSGDLCNHPVGFFLESLLAQIDSSRLELIAYPTDSKADELTTRIKPCFSAWKTLVGTSDESAARTIHADGVHVLLDISGHMAKNRLPVFAWKPAPVQASWMGFLATTGVKEIDYVLGDLQATPPEDEVNFSEKVWRLPETYCCFTPPDVELEVGPLPTLSAGFITFGCFNHLAKMTDDVVALWARVLKAVPGSRLFLKTKQLNDPDVREATRKRFAVHGIESGKLLLEGASPRAELLAAYQRVDISLDPFPYNGATTSMESLWMAVPVITRKGDRFLSRCGQSIVSNAGLDDWIAENDDDYVAKAVMHSAHPECLAALRTTLRQQVLASPLFDAPRFARHFEDALWGMWEAQAHAAKTGAIPPPFKSAAFQPDLSFRNVTDTQEYATMPSKRVLCIETSNWVGIERLAIHLSESGLEVGCLCTNQSVLNKISTFACYHWGQQIDFDVRLEQVIMDFKPDLLIFMDDLSFRMISNVIILNPQDILSRQKYLFEKSLGDIRTVGYRILRRTLVQLQECVKVPKTVASGSLAELSEFGASVGWRAFFKEEFTCSGMGVVLTKSEQMFRETARQLLDAGKQFIVQERIHGVTAMRAAVAYEGKILCGISFNKVTASAGGIGYSTVVMPAQHEEMKLTTEKIAELLKITGPFSCDFIVDDETGAAYLIEINPRPTTVFHLGYLFGVSFASSFGAIIDGTPRIQNDDAPEGKEVALFPKELIRDLRSPRLTTAMHDVPWAYPGIVVHYLSMIAGARQ